MLTIKPVAKSKKKIAVAYLDVRYVSNKWSLGNPSIQTKRMSDFNSGPSLLRKKTCQSRRQGELYSFFVPFRTFLSFVSLHDRQQNNL